MGVVNVLLAMGLSPTSEQEVVRRYLAEMYSEGLIQRRKVLVNHGRSRYEYATFPT